MSGRRIVTVGNFDGVHLGHAALIERARRLADELSGKAGQGRVNVAALAFDPSPQEVLTGTVPMRLTTFAQRVELLKAAGADEVVALKPTAELLGYSPREFVEYVIAEYGAAGIVEGVDFRFGVNRSGDAGTLVTLGREMKIRVEIVEPMEVVLGDHTIAAARSTNIRWLLTHGRVSDAALMLGRRYEMIGTVVQGDRRGRTIGFPTANLSSQNMPPMDGIYAATARLPTGRTMHAAVSIGTKPTFGAHQRAVEAYLFSSQPGSKDCVQMENWETLPGLPEYGWTLGLSFAAYLRDQIRFDSLAGLLEQIRRDVARSEEILTMQNQMEMTA